MEINFGTNNVRATIAFDWTENANYNFANTEFWIHGTYFNGKVYFPYGATKLSLANSYKLNKQITIPNSVTNVSYMFRNCRNFNQNIQIPNSVTNTFRMFSECSNFNQNIQIPFITSTSGMFAGCSNFNQNIQIPNSVTNVSYMFSSCPNFNQNIYLHKNLRTHVNLFANCHNLNQNIYVRADYTSGPSMIVNLSNMFINCNNLSDVTLSDNMQLVGSYVFTSVFRSNNSQSLNIHTGSNLAQFIINNTKCIQGNGIPEWSVIDNGYYNALYNIYIYTNTVFPD